MQLWWLTWCLVLIFVGGCEDVYIQLLVVPYNVSLSLTWECGWWSGNYHLLWGLAKLFICGSHGAEWLPFDLLCCFYG